MTGEKTTRGEWVEMNEFKPDVFQTIPRVLEYLKKAGWRITKASLYRHHREGKFRPQHDGTYLQKDVDRYAKRWLKQVSTGRLFSDKLPAQLQQKLELEHGQGEIQPAARARLINLLTDSLRYLVGLQRTLRAGSGGANKELRKLIYEIKRELEESRNSKGG